MALYVIRRKADGRYLMPDRVMTKRHHWTRDVNKARVDNHTHGPFARELGAVYVRVYLTEEPPK